MLTREPSIVSSSLVTQSPESPLTQFRKVIGEFGDHVVYVKGTFESLSSFALFVFRIVWTAS